ncbi:MAG TPA: Ppx/GppA family phosphatase [Moorella mulderi]|nr:Ppx/GppA family phosphatase [Moorella mulderi]
MPCYAAIDVGSNSVRLLVGEVEEGKVKPLFFTLRMTRLLGGAKGGNLEKGAIERTVEAVEELVSLARNYQPEDIICVGTSAVREAPNADLLFSSLEKSLGLRLKVIGGETEARLNYLGVLSGFPQLQVKPLVVDIGGGSTEFSWEKNGLQLVSLPLGAIRATEGNLSEEDMKILLRPILKKIPKEAAERIIGTGGTITSLAAMDLALKKYKPELVHGHYLPTEVVERWYRKLKGMSLEERKRLPGLQPQRADIIVAGVAILWCILQGLKGEGIWASESDLLWGVLLARSEGALES